MSSRAQTKLYRARPGRFICPTGRCEQPREARPAGVAPSDARRIGQLRVSQEQPGAAARCEALPCGSERQDFPLSQASHVHGFASESQSRLWRSCVVVALFRAVQRSARMCSSSVKFNLRNLIKTTHARRLLPAALASVPFGFVLVRVFEFEFDIVTTAHIFRSESSGPRQSNWQGAIRNSMHTTHYRWIRI
jgi:hypothetical protein